MKSKPSLRTAIIKARKQARALPPPKPSSAQLLLLKRKPTVGLMNTLSSLTKGAQHGSIRAIGFAVVRSDGSSDSFWSGDCKVSELNYAIDVLKRRFLEYDDHEN
jgi:hypothetical protein